MFSIPTASTTQDKRLLVVSEFGVRTSDHVAGHRQLVSASVRRAWQRFAGTVDGLGYLAQVHPSLMQLQRPRRSRERSRLHFILKSLLPILMNTPKKSSSSKAASMTPPSIAGSPKATTPAAPQANPTTPFRSGEGCLVLEISYPSQSVHSGNA